MTRRKSWNTTPIRRRKPGRRFLGMVTMSSPNNLIRPAARPLGEVEQFQQRGLARARRPGEEVEAAVAEREAQIRKRLRPRPIAQPDIVELDDVAEVAQTRLRTHASMARTARGRKPLNRSSSEPRCTPPLPRHSREGGSSADSNGIPAFAGMTRSPQWLAWRGPPCLDSGEHQPLGPPVHDDPELSRLQDALCGAGQRGRPVRPPGALRLLPA